MNNDHQPRTAPAARFLIMSDTHVSLAKPYRAKRLENVISKALELQPDSTAIIVGDFTDYGMPWEYRLVARAARRAGLQRDRLVLALGNHECRLPRFAWSLSRFARRVGSKAPYRDLTVGRAHLILLAGDEKPQRWDGCRISDGQLEWLDRLLSSDEEEGSVSLVFNHEPLFDTVEGSLAHHGSGRSIENDADLRAVLDRHPGAYVFTGHSHFPLGTRRIGDGPTFANTGAIAYDDGYGREFAQGWFATVDERGVSLRGYDFIEGSWIDGCR